MNKTINYDSLRVPDRIRTPLIFAIPLLSYVAGTIVMVLARQELWSIISQVMTIVGVLFAVTFIPVATVLAFKMLTLQKQVGMTSDWHVPNEMSRYYFQIFKPDIPFAEHRKWFVRTYYLGYGYVAIVLLVTVFSWADII